MGVEICAGMVAGCNFSVFEGRTPDGPVHVRWERFGKDTWGMHATLDMALDWFESYVGAVTLDFVLADWIDEVGKYEVGAIL